MLKYNRKPVVVSQTGFMSFYQGDKDLSFYGLPCASDCLSILYHFCVGRYQFKQVGLQWQRE